MELHIIVPDDAARPLQKTASVMGGGQFSPPSALLPVCWLEVQYPAAEGAADVRVTESRTEVHERCFHKGVTVVRVGEGGAVQMVSSVLLVRGKLEGVQFVW